MLTFARQTRFVGLYSFKGGVGRTTLAVGVALRLYQQGQRVLLCDLDLESPGLSLTRPLAGHAGRSAGALQALAEALAGETGGGAGLSTVRLSEREGLELPAPWRDRASLTALPAGLRLEQGGKDETFNGLMRELRGARPEGVRERLRTRLTGSGEPPDVVLLDLSAGTSELSAWCAMHLVDALIVLVRPDGQGLAGTRDALARWRRVPALLVASQVPPVHDERLEAWRTSAERQLGRPLDAELPYCARMSMEEGLGAVARHEPVWGVVRDITRKLDALSGRTAKALRESFDVAVEREEGVEAGAALFAELFALSWTDGKGLLAEARSPRATPQKAAALLQGWMLLRHDALLEALPEPFEELFFDAIDHLVQKFSIRQPTPYARLALQAIEELQALQDTGRVACPQRRVVRLALERALVTLHVVRRERAEGLSGGQPGLGDGALGDGALGDGALGDGALGDGALRDAAEVLLEGLPVPSGSNATCIRRALAVSHLAWLLHAAESPCQGALELKGGGLDRMLQIILAEIQAARSPEVLEGHSNPAWADMLAVMWLQSALVNLLPLARGDAALQRELLARLAECNEETRARDPSNPGNDYILGILMVHEGQVERAFQALERCASRTPAAAGRIRANDDLRALEASDPARWGRLVGGPILDPLTAKGGANEH
ncbi:MAG: AAA family ATPase [Alphaproteobacteria bacterium]|nr:AAA family ATPase [Alphaproteobacteria bacterium]